MRCQACGYLIQDCVCDRVEPRKPEPRPAVCSCCGLAPADEDADDNRCDNESCSLFEVGVA